VDVAALAASLGMLALVYRRDIPRAVATSDLPEPFSAIRDPRLFRFGWLVLALLAAGYLASHPLGLPVSAVAGGAAVALVAMAWRNPELRVPRLIAAAPWHILVFSVGMYVVVFGLGHAGLIALVGRALAWAAAHGTGASVLTAGYLAAGLSSIMNNLPAVLLVALGVGGSGARGAPRLAMALGNVIGSDVGPKTTPIGSLGTLLWLHVLERRGLRIGWGYYVRVGLTLTLPVLTAALLALWAVLRLQRAA
jgi:arsenical pump membrane protein